MGRRPLDAATAKRIQTDAFLAARVYSADPGAVVDELHLEDSDVLAAAALFAGAHGHEPEERALVDALLAVVGEHPAVELGRRQVRQHHSAT